MKTIGLLGGMSWESTASYYQAINQGVKARLGGLHSAKVCLHSVDFGEVSQYQLKEEWNEVAEILIRGARSVEASGADFLLICTNTMHKLAPEIEAAINIPLLHIADATAEQLLADGRRTVGLLGTSFTMEQDFYKGRLEQKYGIRVLVPDAPGRELVHRVIFEELCIGELNDESRRWFVSIIDDLRAQGAEAIILGCTEIALLVRPEDTDVPLYDTVEIHADAAVELALNEK